eukprot:SAG11_NODE_52_length_19809_cov_14.064231_19_plen_56_part_00
MKKPLTRTISQAMGVSPRARSVAGDIILTQIMQEVEVRGVRAIECLFMADTDGSG